MDEHEQLASEPGRALPPQYHGETCVVSIFGEIDMASAPMLREALDTAIVRGAHKLIADLSGVTFLDSTGLGVLLRCDQTLAETGGELIVVIRNHSIRRTIEVANLDLILHLETTLITALLQFATR